MGRFIEMDGTKHGKLTVIKRAGTSNDGQALWQCECECGNATIVDGKSLRQGGTKTCGCSKKNPRPNAIKHGFCDTRLYRIWGNMKHRCYGKRDAEKYKYYGGRGILVCDEWQNFINFKKWADSSGYKDTLTLDRVDNNKGYSPDNCKWVSVKEQSMNRRSNHIFTEKGQSLSIKQWAEKLGVSHSTIINRIKKGASVYGTDTLA